MSSNVTVTIGGSTYSVLTTSSDPITTDDTSDGRSVATFDVNDPTGTVHFQPGQPVQITDTLNNYTYSGYINDSQEVPLPPSSTIISTINCVDGSYIPFKRYYSGPEYQNRNAGDIVTDLVANVVGADGITANYATDTDQSVGTWQEGTQNNTAAIGTSTGGALELALAGNIVTKTESTSANWNAGTLTGAMVNGNLLQLNAHPALSFSGTCSSGYGNAYAYYKIWSGNYVIATGDVLTYKMWINSSSPSIMAGVDGICTDGTSIRDFNIHGGGSGGPQDGFNFDQNGLRMHPGTDLSGFANDQWYTRSMAFPSGMVGKTLSYVDIAFEGDNAGTYQAYFYDIFITNGGTVSQNLFGNQGIVSPLISFPNLSAKVSNVGYSNVQVNAITAYESTGTRVSAANSMQNAGIYQSSLISWLATVPTNTSLNVYTSVDGGATYQPATNQSPITNIPLGASLVARNITTKIVMSISGKDPTATPQVSNVTWTVEPSYAATKTDTRSKFDTQANWNTGTLTNLVATSGGDLTINSFQKNWNDGSTSGQTLFGGGGSALQSTFKYAGSLRAAAGTVAQSQLNNAGTWQNFTVSIDVQVPASSVFVGLEYRQTYFDNLPNTGAYLVDLSTTSFNFGKGTNNVTNSHTSFQAQSFSPALNTGDWHTITIVVSGTTHTHYLDGVNYWPAQTDASFTGAGYFVLRIFNSTAGDYTTYYDNFGVMDSSGVYPGPGTFSGPTWVSPSISLGSLTAGNNLIFWDASTIAGDFLNVQTSFNGGTYTNCTSGAAIPGIVSGTAYVSATLQVKIQMQAATAADTPVVHGLTAWVTSLYSSSGNRISVPLSLAPVGIAGSSSITWLGSQPPNTNIFVDTSTDGTNWTNAGVGASGTAQVSGILTQTDPIIDNFTTDTSSNYTSTCRTGGTIASWIWDTILSRLEVSGGVNAHLLYNSPVTGADTDISAVMDKSDNGGFIWRWLDQGDHYSLAIHDDTSPNNPNTMQLYVVTGGGGGTITPLTLYYTNVTSATASSAKQLSETLGTGAFTTKQSTIGTATGFGELFGAGTTNPWGAGVSLIAPSDNGFIDDSTTLEGQQLIGGIYTPVARLGLNLTATITADVYLRISKRASGGTKTLIGDCLLSGQTITGTTATYTFPGTNLGSMSFTTGDKLCFNYQLNVLTNANGLSTLACKIGESNAANTGLTTSQVATPGFQLTGTSGATTLLNTTPINFTRNTPHVFEVTMVGQAITVLMDGTAIISVNDGTIVSAGFAGFRNDNSGGGSAANFYLMRLQYYGQDVTGMQIFSRFRFTTTDPTVTPYINQYSMSVHDPAIQNGALIPQTSYSILNGNKTTLGGILDDLVKQSGTIGLFWWRVINGQVNFQQHQSMLAPWVLTPADTMIGASAGATLQIDNINDQYRNNQWIPGGVDIVPQTRSFIGDGETTTFDVGYDIDSISSIGLNGATQLVGVKGVDVGKDWYYTQGQSALVQDASEIPLSKTQVLTVNFNGQIDITVNVPNSAEIIRIGNLDQTTGIIDEGEDGKGLNKQQCISKGLGMNSTYGQKAKSLQCSTLRTGLAVGQLLPVFNVMGIFDGSFLITEVKTTWQPVSSNGTTIMQPFFEIYASSGPLAISFERFINNLSS